MIISLKSSIKKEGWGKSYKIR